MEKMLNLWIEGFWYHKVYLFFGAVGLLTLIIFLTVIIPYLDTKSKVDLKFKQLCSKHFFISFRGNKRNELYAHAEYNFSNLPYLIGKYSKNISFICVSIAFWFFIGSNLVDEMFYDPETSDNYLYPEIDYDEDVDNIENDENGFHHVDPHRVESYERSDGTEVDGYWRGGDDGYERSDPNDDTGDNLESGYDSGADENNDGYDGIGAEIGEWLTGN